jgi:hypothetical protein
MTTSTPSPTLRFLAPLAILVTAAMASANWYFDPRVAAAWAAVLVFTAIMAVALWRMPADSTRRGVVLASLMLMSSLSETFAAGIGLGGAELFEQISTRGWMVLTGLYLMSVGNNIPKVLIPLTQCDDGMRAQAVRRLMGWVWVLTGLSLTLAWLTLPVGIANTVGMTCMVAAMGISATAMMRLRRPVRPRPS